MQETRVRTTACLLACILQVCFASSIQSRPLELRGLPEISLLSASIHANCQRMSTSISRVCSLKKCFRANSLAPCRPSYSMHQGHLASCLLVDSCPRQQTAITQYSSAAVMTSSHKDMEHDTTSGACWHAAQDCSLSERKQRLCWVLMPTHSSMSWCSTCIKVHLVFGSCPSIIGCCHQQVI